MTPPGRLSSIVAAVTMLALAGCTTVSTGSPMPGDTKAGSTDPTTNNSEPSSTRPREIDLTGKDPCAVIPQSDWPNFGIERPGERSEDPALKSPRCYYSGDRAGDVILVMTEGIDAWTEGDRGLKVNAVEPIDGFPTITMVNNAGGRSCFAAVDVAEGQYLLTQTTPDPNDPSAPERCDLAYQLAKSAMKTLVAS